MKISARIDDLKGLEILINRGEMDSAIVLDLKNIESLIEKFGIEVVTKATERVIGQEEARDFLIYHLWGLVKYYKGD